MKKKLIKVHGKLNVWEVSACGIPMYPKAHKSFSLIKALRETEESSDELNLEKKEMESEEPEKPEEKSEGESEDSESKESEETTETAEKEKTEEPETETDKSINFKDLQNVISKGFQQAIKESRIERGLIETEVDIQKQMREELSKKSIGELAIMSGLFQEPPVMGSTREIE